MFNWLRKVISRGDVKYLESKNLIKSDLQLSDILNNKFPFYPVVIDTNEVIRPLDLSFGMPATGVMAKIGNPVYSLDNSLHIPTHQVHFFRKRLRDLNLVYQFHFLGDYLFFISFHIDPRSRRVDNFRDEIKRIICQKYVTDDSLLNTVRQQVLVRDRQGNLLIVEDHLDYRVNYLDKSPDFIQKAMAVIEAVNQSKANTSNGLFNSIREIV